MRFRRRFQLDGLPLTMTVFATVLLAGVSAVPAADNVYFVQRQVGNPASPIGSSGAMSHLGRSSGRGANSAQKPAQPKFVSDTVNRVTRTDPAGGSLKVLFETGETITAVSVTSDGSRILLVVQNHHQASAPARQSQPAKVVSQIIILLPSGTVERTIELGESDLKVFGTAVLLPDKKHVGLTVCKLPDEDALKNSLSTQQPQPMGPRSGPRPPVPHPTDPHSAKEMLEQLAPPPTGQRTIGAGGGVFPNQPYIATIDLSGHGLKQIGPGAMPCWSADGKTILFTSVTVARPFADPGRPRLSVMSADGSGAHPVAAEMTWDGSFSGDATRIVYVAGASGSTQIMMAGADGSGATAVKLPSSIYSSPRWLADGKAIEFASRADAPAKTNGFSGHAVAGQGPIRGVFTAGIDGSAVRQVSPQIAANTPHGSGIDQDAELFLMKMTQGRPGGPGPVAGPDAKTDAPPRDPAESSRSPVAAARSAFEDAVQMARKRLLASFDAAIAEATQSPDKADGTPGSTAVAMLTQEKQRFEKQGLVPWSRPMWKAVGEYLDAVNAARTTVHAALPAEAMPGDLRDKVDKQVVAKWRHRPGNRQLVLVIIYLTQ